MAGTKMQFVKSNGLLDTDVDAFRSEPHKTVISSGISSKSAPSGMGSADAKVSEYGLEAYLNACAPTCHG
jgi:hypothetical protein